MFKQLFNKRNKTLMVQGTTSDAGKSIMVAGLCRLIARQKTKTVAPFKPQNMALNSAVTADSGEIGRAQALQAQACYLPAHTDMNPILLKPSSDTGAQVIIHGHVISAMQATQYHDYKKVAMQAVLESHSRLQSQYDTIVVEGAGSPAEINLRENDIANMGFAEAVDCPVIIVADIDRGGVFAHLYGTLELLSQSEQDRVVGFIINRFRGDIKLLENGLTWLENRTNKAVLGVIPYLPDFYLDAEDAIATQQLSHSVGQQVLNVIVPVLPRISNHTDFDALRLHPNVNLQFVPLNQALPPSDLIILPGSKNVRDDLEVLKQFGWQDKLNKHLRYGGKVIGICGGYQMLGQHIDDPLGFESAAGRNAAFGFLGISTTLKSEKRLRQVKGEFNLAQFGFAKVSGYEIHCGISTPLDGSQMPLLTLSNIDSETKEEGFSDGAINTDQSVIGTYLHGLFDEVSSSHALLQWAGLNMTDGNAGRNVVDLNAVREQQLERLADCLEKNLKPEFIKQLLK